MIKCIEDQWIKNIKFKIIRIWTGHSFHSENLNWATQKFWMGRMRLDIAAIDSRWNQYETGNVNC